jgi:hypothetical protein
MGKGFRFTTTLLRSVSDMAKPLPFYCRWRQSPDVRSTYNRNAELTQSCLSIYLSDAPPPHSPQKNPPSKEYGMGELSADQDGGFWGGR